MKMKEKLSEDMKNKEEKEEEVALWILAKRTCIKGNEKH
jgi:hypothetical protein